MHALTEKVQQYIHQHALLRPGQRVLVGVSGGADSVGLLLILAELSRDSDLKLELTLAHVDHCIRGAKGQADAEFVAELAGKLALPICSQRIDVPDLAAKENISLETAARRARYDFFLRTATENQCAAVAIAHHANDQVETVLHRIVRGTGLPGLSGMRPGRLLCREPEIRLVRPMLDCRRDEIEQFLIEREQLWRVDHTNLEAEATRNRIRLELLPLLREKFNPRVEQAVLRLSGLAEQVNDFVDEQTSKQLPAIARCSGSLMCIDLNKLTQEHQALQRRVVRKAWELLGLGQRDMSLATIEGILTSGREHLDRNRPSRLELPGRAEAVFQFGRLLLRAKNCSPQRFGPVELCVPGTAQLDLLGLSVQAELLAGQGDPSARLQPANANQEVIDADTVQGQLVIRPPLPNETFPSLGGKTLSMEEFLLSCKIPKLLHPLTAVLADDEGAIWVVGHRLAQRVRLGANSKRGIELSCRWK